MPSVRAQKPSFMDRFLQHIVMNAGTLQRVIPIVLSCRYVL
jgi:hypothetical protein